MDDNNHAGTAVRRTRQFLVHLDSDLIRRIKILAIERNVSASSLVQRGMLEFLATDAGIPRKKNLAHGPLTESPDDFELADAAIHRLHLNRSERRDDSFNPDFAFVLRVRRHQASGFRLRC